MRLVQSPQEGYNALYLQLGYTRILPMDISASGLTVFTSNRLEVLVEKLAEVLMIPLSSPLVPEVIVVQSKGMERWISMQLARCHGICAHCRFPFPNEIIRELFRATLPYPSDNSPFDPEALTWRIMNLLPRCLQQPGFEPIQRYLGDDADDLKRYQLSQQIAALFDQYLVFRPNMIMQWERSEENHWQAMLWRMCTNQETRLHQAASRELFLKEVGRSIDGIRNLPERISVFGISALPPFHMELLHRSSSVILVNFFLLNPCREYWGDIVSCQEARRVQRRYGEHQITDDLHLERGNSLLSSLGKMGRDFFGLVHSFECQEYELFRELPGQDMLPSIQRDILMLRDSQPGSTRKTLVTEGDTSIQVHSCHSAMREVEVLYNCLLDMFEKDSSLKPEDILVMAPDIEQYIPFIQAVFEAPSSEGLRIPYSIADQSLERASSVIQSLLAILELSRSRFGASVVLEILESEPVYTAFDLSESELELIKHWIDQTGIRWGVDEKTRLEQGLGAYADNSWWCGLQRLLLGYALPGNNEDVFHDVLPYDHIEGDDAIVLGKFLHYVEQLFAVAKDLRNARTLEAWSQTLGAILNRFFAPPLQQQRELQFLQRLVYQLVEKQELSGFRDPVDLRVISAYLRQQCRQERLSSGFASGGVTFGTLLPMRSIPFSVICLVGMNNDAYPRTSRQLSFDLIARHPRPGDRSRKSNDRYLFLEALISARKCLYASYEGQSLRDNSTIPPSVVISELLDYLDANFTVGEGSILDHVITRHALQAFSPSYFRANRKLFSYSEEECQAAQRSLEQRAPCPAFINRGIMPPSEEWKIVPIERLCRFFLHPVRFFLKERLGLHLDEAPSSARDREPFEVHGLEKYQIERELLEKRLSGADLIKHATIVRASGKLPPGRVGDCLYEHMVANIERLVQTIFRYRDGAPGSEVALDLDVGAFKLQGVIRNVYDRRLVQCRCAAVRPGDLLLVWIQHVALNTIGDREPVKSYCIGLGEKNDPFVYVYRPPSFEHCRAILSTLLNHYWNGLTTPLPFFRDSSWEFARAVISKGLSESEGVAAATKTWQKSDYHRGEGIDLSHQQCFRGRDPFNDAFTRIALDIFEPLLSCLEAVPAAETVPIVPIVPTVRTV